MRQWRIEALSDDEAERVLYPIWGKAEKLATLARKAQQPRKELLLRLLKALGTEFPEYR